MYSEEFISWRDNVQQSVEEEHGFQFTIEDIDEILSSFDNVRGTFENKRYFLSWTFSEASKLIGEDRTTIFKVDAVQERIAEAIGFVAKSHEVRFLNT